MNTETNDAYAANLVIFDMDGVVFEGRNFWLDLHRTMGTEAEAWQLWNAYGQTDYARLGAITVEEVWRGRNADPLFALNTERRYVDGVADVFGWLKARSIRTAIVSTGPYQLAQRAQRELGVDHVLANRVAIVDGRFAGTVEIMVDENRKDDAALRIMAELGAPSAATAMVGDTRGDARMAAVVGLAIAYDPDDAALTAAAHRIIPSGHLRDVVEILSTWKPSGAR